MIVFSDSRILQSAEKPVANGATVTAEGQALVVDNSSGSFGVKPSTGAANEKFAGMSIAQQLTILALPNFESLVANSSSQVATTYTPTSGTLRVYDVTGGTLLTAGTPGTNANQYSISGNTITVNSALNGHTITVAYRYAPTTLQAQAAQGQIPAGGAAALILGTVGVIEQGHILTSEYDTSVDWTQPNIAITLGANGLFTIGGTGTVVNGYVTDLPSATSPYLGLHFVA